MAKKIVLTNDFHDTEVHLVPRGNRLSRRQVARARRILCAVHGCRCGGDAGERGRQLQPDGSTIDILAAPDGGALVDYAVD